MLRLGDKLGRRILSTQSAAVPTSHTSTAALHASSAALPGAGGDAAPLRAASAAVLQRGGQGGAPAAARAVVSTSVGSSLAAASSRAGEGEGNLPAFVVHEEVDEHEDGWEQERGGRAGPSVALVVA